MKEFKRIIVATDFGEASDRALARAIDLAEAFQAELTVAHCFEVPAYAYGGMYTGAVDVLGSIRDAAEAELRDLMKRVHDRLPSAKSALRSGVPHEEILSLSAQHHADLIVVGTHGRRGVSRLVIGSVAEKIVRLSLIPVLTVRGEPTRT